MSDYIELTKEQESSDEIGFYNEPAFVEKLDACWGLGPLDICVTKASATAVDFEIKLGGIRIGSGTLNAKDPKACVSANVGLAKVSLCIEIDLAKKEVWARGKVCVRRFDGRWSCRKFSAKLLSW